MSDRPLTPAQHRAADLVGRGWKYRDVAREVSVHPDSIKRWNRDPLFRTAVKRARDVALNEQPTAKSVLESALHATTGRSGEPDWQTRVQAARILFGKSPEPEPAPRETRIYVDKEEE